MNRRGRDDADETGGPERADRAVGGKREQQAFIAGQPPLREVMQRAEEKESDQQKVESDVRSHGTAVYARQE